MSASCHDVLTPVIAQQCCDYFRSSGPFQCGCIQSRKLKKSKKHSFTGEQLKIHILSYFIAILSQTLWQSSALFNTYLKRFGFVQLWPMHSTTAMVRHPKTYSSPFHHLSEVLVIKIIMHNYDK